MIGVDMGDYDDLLRDVSRIAEQINALAEQAYYVYKVPVEQLCRNRDATLNDVEWMLDHLLDFCGYEKVLTLYKQVCRTFVYRYPECIEDYIKLYFEFYEPEKLKDITGEDPDEE